LKSLIKILDSNPSYLIFSLSGEFSSKQMVRSKSLYITYQKNNVAYDVLNLDNDGFQEKGRATFSSGFVGTYRLDISNLIPGDYILDYLEETANELKQENHWDIKIPFTIT